MSTSYFGDRELGPRPRISEDIPENAWGGIVSLIESRITDGSLGYGFPRECQDRGAISGCDRYLLGQAIIAEHPEIPWPLDALHAPPPLAVLDLLQFCHRAIAKPVHIRWHDYYRHYDLSFQKEEGEADFQEAVNRIFARNGIAFELGSDSEITRLAPPVLREALRTVVFRTGDSDLDSLLETARRKYLSPDPDVRREAIEKLWDAWERLKTLEAPSDKRASVTAMLNKAAAEPRMRQVLEQEAKMLTDIGNQFRIRHSEIGKVAVEDSEQVDYLFHRLFSLIRLLLRCSGRGG